MINAVLRRMPLSTVFWLRRVFRRAEPLLGRFGMTAAGRTLDGRDPFDHISGAGFRAISKTLRRNPYSLLQVREIRQVLARERVHALMARNGTRRIERTGDRVVHNTLEYNLEGAMSAADQDRPAIMINVASAVERIQRNAAALDVLSIGPRSEIEIFALLAAGFSRDRIKALDLFSYSPYVEIGDMHAMPFADGSFDLVFLGWVLSYSKDQAHVASQVLKVCRDRAVVVIAGDYSDETHVKPTFRGENTYMKNCDQLLQLFAGHVGQVFFRHDPDPPHSWMVMTAFEVRKP